MSNSTLDEWADAIQGLLKAGYKVALSATSHGLLLGDARELMIKEVLMRFLPSSLVIGSGQVIDSNGNRSEQIDIVIYRSNFPIFRTLGVADVFMLEGVAATIEVKSTLTRPKLEEALNNCVSIKKLSPCYEVPSAIEYCKRQQLQYTILDIPFPDIQGPAKEKLLEQVVPPTYVFGYTGYASHYKALANAVMKWYDSRHHPAIWLPDVIATAGCVVLKTDNRPFRSLQFEKSIYAAKQDATPIKYLLNHLLHRLMTSIGIGVAVDAESGIILRSDIHTMIDTSGEWLAFLERKA